MTSKKAIFSLIVVLTLVMGIWVALDRWYMAFEKAPVWPLKFKNYVLEGGKAAPEGLALKPYPDLSQFTMDNLLAKIPERKDGRIRIGMFKENTGFDKFTEVRRQVEFSRLQGREEPIAIMIERGVYDLPSVLKAINDDSLMSMKDGAYVLHVPLYVERGAGLVVSGTQESPLVLKMSSVTGGFLVNAGKMFIVDARVEGWDDKKGVPAPYADHGKNFRPFVATWSGSETYFGRAGFYDLGYAASKSYGITFSASKEFLKQNPDIPRPKGWIIESRFERLHYGFYCYEAEDVAIVNSVYYDNIIYGIDPHDRSDRLLIAGNDVSKTRKKHGIIGSREVNDSWIINNKSYDNHGSGFMLDRTSIRNLVEGNVAYDNGSDGITLFESQDNVIVNNKAYRNGKNGLRLRNSWNVEASGNILAFNRGVGLQVYAQDIVKEETDRDFEEDPFTQKAGIDFTGNIVLWNSAGEFKLNNIDFVRLSGVTFGLYDKKFVRGDLDNIASDVAFSLRRNGESVSITRIPERQVEKTGH